MKYRIILLGESRSQIEQRESEHGSDIQAIVHATQLLRSTPGADAVRIETEGALVAEFSV